MTKETSITIYLTEEEKKRIKREATKLGISVSAYVKVKLFSK
jgi:predicted DNA binding CopG/RHH family protein